MPNTKLDQARDLLRQTTETTDPQSSGAPAGAVHALAAALALTIDAVEETQAQDAANAPTEPQLSPSSGEPTEQGGTVLEAVPPLSAAPPGLYEAPRNDDGTVASNAPAGLYEPRRNEDGSIATD